MPDRRNSIGKSLLVAAGLLLALAAPLGAETRRFKPAAGVQTIAAREQRKCFCLAPFESHSLPISYNVHDYFIWIYLRLLHLL